MDDKTFGCVEFERWWAEEGRLCDPDRADVPWVFKRKQLAELAFAKGVEIGMARECAMPDNPPETKLRD